MSGVWLCSAPWRDAHLDLMPALESLLRASHCNLKFIPGSLTTPVSYCILVFGVHVVFACLRMNWQCLMDNAGIVANSMITLIAYDKYQCSM